MCTRADAEFKPICGVRFRTPRNHIRSIRFVGAWVTRDSGWVRDVAWKPAPPPTEANCGIVNNIGGEGEEWSRGSCGNVAEREDTKQLPRPHTIASGKCESGLELSIIIALTTYVHKC
jgi:hypothetical protein